ncbi:MAG: hypothetical protein RL299_1476 [Pseudomonadota bacterium]|jgi:heat shock protein HslJ
MFKRFALLALPLLASCATAGTPSAQSTTGKWAFVSIDGKAPVSDKAALTISADRIGANLGCNGLGGDFKIENGHLVTGPIISTMMYCDGLMDQESAVARLLEAKPAFTIKGDRLIIESGQHKAELIRAKD